MSINLGYKVKFLYLANSLSFNHVPLGAATESMKTSLDQVPGKDSERPTTLRTIEVGSWLKGKNYPDSNEFHWASLAG